MNDREVLNRTSRFDEHERTFSFFNFYTISQAEPVRQQKLSSLVQAELIAKSEIIAAQRYTADTSSMFWRFSTEAAERLSKLEVGSLPEDEQLVVKTASTFIK